MHIDQLSGEETAEWESLPAIHLTGDQYPESMYTTPTFKYNLPQAYSSNQ